MANLMKQWMLGEMLELFREHPNFVLVSYTGIDSEETAALRSTVRERKLRMKVVKNRIASRAFDELGYEGLNEMMVGQTAVLFGLDPQSADPVALTKAVADLSKDQAKLEIKGGFAEGQVMDKDGVVAMSKAPSREELYAKMAGLLQAPVVRMIRVTRGPVEKMARLIHNTGKKHEEEGK